MLVTTGSANAQTGIDEELGRASLQDFSGGAALNGTYFDVRNQAGSGVGYRNGFTQFGMFTPFINDGDTMIGGQIRMLVTDTSRIGYNVGGVARRYFEGSDRIWGVNAYFDDDQSTSGYRYRQIAFGFESLGRYLDFRANGYVPTSNDNNAVGPIGLLNSPFFYGNRIAYTGLVRNEQSLAGGDFEFGVPVIPGQRWLRAYAGMYIYEKPTQGDAPVGVRARVEGWVSDDLSVGMMYTNDKQFGSNLNAVVDFRFSGYKATRYFPHYTVRERMLMPVQRNWRVATTEYNTTTKVDIYNPADLNPYFVTWVDSASTAAGPGTGTFEDPFKQLPANAPGSDLVLVRRGNSTQANPYDGSITLDPNTRMLGEGIAHQFDGYAQFGAYQQGGTYTLPGFTNSGLAPYLTSTTGDVITVADNNEVRSFNIQNGFGSGITNNPATGVNNFLLRDLNLTANAAGINLRNAYGTGRIENVLANNNAGGGVVIDSGTEGLTLAVNGLSSNAGIGGPQAYGLYLLADDGELATTVTGLSALGNGQGLRLETVGQVLTANVIASTTTGGGDGVFVGAQGGVADVRISDIQANSNSGTGVTVIGVDGAAVRTEITNGAIAANGLDAINVVAMGHSEVDVIADPIDASGSGRHGFNYTVETGAILRADILDLDFRNSGVNGVNGSVDGLDSVGYVLLQNTNLFNAGQDAFNLNVDNGGVSTVEMRGGLFEVAGRNAIRANVDRSGVLNMFVTDASGAIAGESGAVVTTNNSAVFNGNFLRSNFSGSGFGSGLFGAGVRDAMNLTALGNSTLSVNMNATPTREVGFLTQENSLAYNVATGGQLIFTNNGGDMRSNLRSAITGTVDGAGSVARINMNNTSGANSGATGFQANVTNSGSLITSISNGSFSQAGGILGGDGVAINASSQGSAVVDFSGVNVNGAQQNGMRLNAATGGDIAVNAVSSSFNNNTLDGILSNVDGAGSNTQLVMQQSTVDSNGQRGANLSTSNNANMNFVTTPGNGSSFSNNLNGEGLFLRSTTGANLTSSLQSIRVDNNAGAGVRAIANAGGQLDLAMAGNTGGGSPSSVSNNLGGPGINFISDGAGSIGRLGLNNVIINNNAGHGVDITQSNGGVVQAANLIDNVIEGNQGAGINILGGSGTFGPAVISGNTLTENNGGIVAEFLTGANVTLGIVNNTINQSLDDGIRFIHKGSNGDINISNNTVNSPANDGIQVDIGGTASVALRMNDNTVGLLAGAPGLAGDGIRLTTGDTSRLIASYLDGNTVSGAAQHGINVQLRDQSRIDALVAIDNQVNGSGLNGFNLEAPVLPLNFQTVTLGGLFIGSVGRTSQFSGNGGDGISIQLNDLAGAPAVIPNININNVDIVGNGSRGINLVANNSFLSEVNLIDVRVSNSLGQSGIRTEFNGGQLNQLVIAGGTVNGTANTTVLGTGIDVSLNNVLGIPSVTVANMTVTNSAGRGISIVGNSDVNEVLVSNNTVSNSFGGQGVFVSLLNSTANNVTARDNTVSDSGSTGIDLLMTSVAGLQTVRVDNNTVDDSAAYGVSIWGISSPINEIQANGNTITDAVGDGLLVRLQDSNTNGVFITDSNITSNDENGINFELLNSSLDTTIIGTYEARSNISNNNRNGIRFGQINSNVVDLNIQNSTISNNGTSSTFNGIEFLTANSNLERVTIRDNTMNANNGDGVRLINPVTNSNNNIDMVFYRNTITNSVAGNGINVALNNAVGRSFRTTLDNNTISNNSLNGFNLEASQNAVATFTMAAGPEVNPVSGLIGNNISNNGVSGTGMGVRVNADNDATINLRIGTAGDNGSNTVSGNRDAGIGVNLRNTADLTAAVANITISNTVNGTGADTNFNGEGFAVRMIESATFNDSVIGTEPGSLRTTNFTGNASHGISIFADGFSAMNNLRVQNVNSSNNLGVGNGLNFVRAGAATFNNTLIQLNTFSGNNNGVGLTASNAALVDEYTLNNNTISNNRANGVALLQRFDAQLQVDLARNTITLNGGDGVQLREEANDPTDLRIATGTWTSNLIANNTGDGIDLQGVHNLSIGTSLATGNDISSNGQNGIRITGTGNVSVVSVANISGNFIDLNGANGIEVVAIANTVNIDENTLVGNAQTGVRLENQSGGLTANLTRNIIEQNGIDGVEILTSGTGVFSRIAVTGNSIADNLGRGVDILTRVNALADITITNNDISRNRREGVYLVNTSSATQTQDSTSTAVAADGSLFVTPRTVFNMSGNTVFDNGFSSSFSGTGLAVRVGTSAGLNPFDSTDPGDFVSTNGGAGFTATTGDLTGAGGVLAAIDNNVFGGSAGSDVLFESFVSTIPVTTTAGTWTDQNENPPNGANDVFLVASFVADPLARLDLRFTGNFGDSADVTRTGASYNNDESVFKSRTIFQSPAGPFLSGTRARNAQRLASRTGFTAPTFAIGGSNSFLYSGVGGSTFRRTNASNTAGFTNADSFFAFDAAFLGVGVGELPFEWEPIAD